MRESEFRSGAFWNSAWLHCQDRSVRRIVRMTAAVDWEHRRRRLFQRPKRTIVIRLRVGRSARNANA